MSLDLSKLTPAPWTYYPGGVYGPEPDEVDVACCAQGNTDAEFIALARNAFDGDPEALAWWEANRRR
jgi:hypothetical protein